MLELGADMGCAALCEKSKERQGDSAGALL
jgi:hypothetical protein